MPLAMQAKLLRVLEEGEVERIGADKPTKVDVRVVVATHRNLEQLVECGRISARSLSSRGGLSGGVAAAASALRRFARAGGALCAPGERAEWMEAGGVQRGAIEALKRYAWPGNIRELRNVVERLLLLADGEVSAEDVRSGAAGAHADTQSASGGSDAAETDRPAGAARACFRAGDGAG